MGRPLIPTFFNYSRMPSLGRGNDVGGGPCQLRAASIAEDVVTGARQLGLPTDRSAGAWARAYRGAMADMSARAWTLCVEGWRDPLGGFRRRAPK